MGVIVNQSIKGAVFSYLGALLGFVNTALLFPIFFSTEQIGLVFLLISISMVLATFFSFGFNGVITRLFPYFNNKDKQHNGFPFMMTAVIISGMILYLILYFAFIRDIIIRQNIHSVSLIRNIDLLIPLVIIEILFRTLNTYASALLNSVIGTFYKEFIIRIVISGLIILHIFKIIDYSSFLYLYIATQVIPVIAILIFLVKNKELDLKPYFGYISKRLKKAIFYTSLITMITGISAMGYQYIDRYMINSFLNLSNTGIYTIAFFFGSFIGIPSRSLRKIAAMVIARAWKNKNYEEVNSIYVKSSITQAVVSLYIFTGIMISISDVIQILGPDYINSKMVVFYIGISFILDLSFGMSSSIISVSRHYRYMSYLMLMFLSVVIISNYIFIPKYGITGAAMASALSMLFYVLIKYAFVWYKFGMQPFRTVHIYILAMGVVLFYVFIHIPVNLGNPYLNIVIRSSVFSLVYLFLTYYFKISLDINNIIDKTLGYFKTGKK